MKRFAITVLLSAVASLALCGVVWQVVEAQPAPAVDLDAGIGGPYRDAGVLAAVAPVDPAPTVTAPPADPEADPVATVKYVRQVHEEDGIPAAIAIGMHLIGLILIRRGGGAWLKGWHLVGVTAGTGVLLSLAGYLAGELTIMALLIAALTTIGQSLVNTGGPKAAGAS